MPAWLDVFRDGILERHGADCTSTLQLAQALSAELAEPVTVDSLFNAHKRHKDKLSLKPSLMDYMSTKEKTPKVKAEDIRWALSDAKWAEIHAAQRFIVTSAMNNSPLHAALWASIKTFAKVNNACILVIPTRYRNPTTRDETRKQAKDAWWPSELHNHLTDEFIELGPEMWLMGHMRIQATAVTPLGGGIMALSRGAHAVYGHPSLAMLTVPRGSQYPSPKILYTTQSCSMPNYSDTRAGAMGEFHHSLGALVLERDEGLFHMRPVTVDDDGGFYDLTGYYSAGAYTPDQPIEVITAGDEHVRFISPQALRGTYTGDDSMVNVLKPRFIVRNDVADMYSINPHERKDPLKRIASFELAEDTLEEELTAVAAHVNSTTPPGALNVFTWSNHPNEHLLRWMKDVNAVLSEPHNANIWLALWRAVLDTLNAAVDGYAHADPFAWWLRRHLNPETRAKFLAEGESLRVADVDHIHGHQGPNGARGSRVNLSRIGTKTTIGHGHSPGIRHGCFQAGTLALKMKYARGGPSAWAACNIVQYVNGKRAPIFVIDGRWRAE